MILAGSPPTVTCTVRCGTGKSAILAYAETLPVIPRGLVWPSPVAYRIAMVPRAAGLRAELQQPVSFNIAACPLPDEFKVNNAGVLSTTASVTEGDGTPWYSTTTCVVVLF